MGRYHRVDWSNEALRARLGTVHDSVIADELGCSRERVRQVRESLGIPSFVSQRLARIQADHPTLYDALGTDSDAALAREHGVSADDVRKLRKQAGVFRLGSPCGTRTRYMSGCRCDACKRANADDMAAWIAKNPKKFQKNRARNRRKVLKSAPHNPGKSGWYALGCRCDGCREARRGASIRATARPARRRTRRRTRKGRRK